jgi:hypothetical protein
MDDRHVEARAIVRSLLEMKLIQRDIAFVIVIAIDRWIGVDGARKL